MATITVTVIDDRMNDYLSKAELSLSQGKFDHALAFLYRGLSLAEVLGDEKYLRQIQLRIARIHHDQGHSNQVIDWCNIALKEDLEPETEAIFLELKVLNLLKIGGFREAEAELLLRADNSNLNMRKTVCLNLGLLYVQLYRYAQFLTLEKAEEYLKEARKLSSEGNSDEVEQAVLARQEFYMALYMLEDGLFFYAKEGMLKALRMENDPIIQVDILNELARVSIKLMEYTAAEDYLEKAHELATQHSFHYGLNYNIYYRGLIYMEQMQMENACSHFLTALYEFLRKNHYPEVTTIFLVLFQIFETSNPMRATKYLEQYKSYREMLDLRDSVDCEEVSKAKELYRWISS